MTTFLIAALPCLPFKNVPRNAHVVVVIVVVVVEMGPPSQDNKEKCTLNVSLSFQRLD